MELLGKLQLAIQPHFESDQIDHYKIFLINSCDRALHFNYEFRSKGLSDFKLSKTIGKEAPFLLNSFELDQLNEQLSAELSFSDRQNGEHILTKTINIKSSLVFKNPKDLPWDLESGWLVLIHEFRQAKAEPKADLSELDIDKLRASMMGGERHKQEQGKAKVTESSRVIDLHAEAFLANFDQMSNAEILKLQLDRFQQALHDATRDSIPKLIVIHGIGKGKLREAIFKLIPEYPQVKSYENSHDHRFGFGATEILLGE